MKLQTYVDFYFKKILTKEISLREAVEAFRETLLINGARKSQHFSELAARLRMSREGMWWIVDRLQIRHQLQQIIFENKHGKIGVLDDPED